MGSPGGAIIVDTEAGRHIYRYVDDGILYVTCYNISLREIYCIRKKKEPPKKKGRARYYRIGLI